LWDLRDTRGAVAAPDLVAPHGDRPAAYRAALAAGAVAAGFAWLYAPVLVKLAHDWSADPNYSHGIIVAPLAAYFAYERRDALRAAAVSPSWAGAVLVAVGLLVLLAGVRGAELFLQRASMVPVLAGSVLLVLGPRHLRLLLFPIGFLLLMIPLPAIVFNQVTFPLQLVASRFGEAVLDAARIPALREGNIILLPYTTLEVVEACSGIRSLVSLVTVAVAFAAFQGMRASAAVVVVASTVPLAIVMNGVRVAGTGVAAHYWGPRVADGFLHGFSGWLVFVATCVALLGVARVVERVLPTRTGETTW
jgi:exosortase